MDMGFTLKDGYYNMGAFYLLPMGSGIYMIYVAMSDDTRKVKWEQVASEDKLVYLFNEFHVFSDELE